MKAVSFTTEDYLWLTVFHPSQTKLTTVTQLALGHFLNHLGGEIGGEKELLATTLDPNSNFQKEK